MSNTIFTSLNDLFDQNSNIFKCDQCDRDFKSLKSLRSHQNFHNPEHQKKILKNQDIEKMKVNQKKHRQKIRKTKEFEFYLNPKICLQCNNQHEYSKRNNKFCSASCGTTYSNKRRKHSEETKNKISKSIKRKEPSSRNLNFKFNYESNPKKCQICNFTLSYKKKDRKTCSNYCLSKLNKSIAQERGKKSAQKRVSRSKDEIALFDFCSTKFECKSNQIIADGWDADIVIESIKVAILWNGPWHYKDMKIKGHSLIQVQNRDKIKINLFESLGWKVLIFEDRYYTPESAFEKLVQEVGFSPTQNSVMSTGAW